MDDWQKNKNSLSSFPTLQPTLLKCKCNMLMSKRNLLFKGVSSSRFHLELPQHPGSYPTGTPQVHLNHTLCLSTPLFLFHVFLLLLPLPLFVSVVWWWVWLISLFYCLLTSIFALDHVIFPPAPLNSPKRKNPNENRACQLDTPWLCRRS